MKKKLNVCQTHCDNEKQWYLFRVITDVLSQNKHA